MSISVATEEGTEAGTEAGTQTPLGLQPLPRLPKAEPAVIVAGTARAGRNPMFERLVEADSDVAGLLAYALYKRNKRDWLIVFEAAHARSPTQAETEAFILGESLPSRITTYRLLAEEMLQRRDPSKSGRGDLHAPARLAGSGGAAAAHALTRMASPMRPEPARIDQKNLAWRQLGLLLLLVVAMAIVFRLLGTWLFSG